MTLNKGAIEILKRMRDYGSYANYDIIEQLPKKFDERDFRFIYNAGFLDVLSDGKELSAIPTEELAKSQYRINAAGLAYLESMKQKIWEEIRAWIAIVISFMALALSATSIFLQILL